MSNAPETDSETDSKTDSETDSELDTDESGGKSGSVGSAGEDDVSDEDREQIEKERQERLDPDNRPDNVEVDNTQRDFDVTTGSFEDHDLDEEEDTGPYNNPFEDGESEGG